MLLLAAALIREQEHGTIEHLLVMPLSPVEIMLGMVLTTLVGLVAQFVPLLLVIMPMILLSGVFTPAESVPEALQWLMVILPMRYYEELSVAVLFRDAGAAVLGRELLLMALIGAAAFAVSLLRFRQHFSAVGSG